MKKVTVSFNDALKSDESKRLYQLAVDIFKQIFTDFYIGDKMLVFDRARGFLADEKFRKTFDKIAKAEVYKGMAWRVHTLVWAAEISLKLPGDFVECGVFRGFKSYFLMDYFRGCLEDRKFWLYDTYEGQPEKYSGTSPIPKSEHDKPGLYEFVLDRFKEFQNANVIKGVAPDIFKEYVPDKVAFLHLDLNSAESEIGVLEYLFDRMPSGAPIILDDYGHAAFHQQKEYEDRWFAERGYKILELPTGQGLVIK